MLKSHSGRIVGLGLLVALAILAAAGLLLTTTNRTGSAFLWVTRNEEVIRQVDELVGDLREAESGQRGYLLTRSPAFLDTFNERIATARRRVDVLSGLTGDDANQGARVDRLRATLAIKVASLRAPLRSAERGDFATATAVVASGRGRVLMEDTAREADAIKSAELGVLRVRSADAQARAATIHDTLLYGGPVAALALSGLIVILVTSFRRPVSRLLAAIEALGAGQLDVRVPTGSGGEELDRLATAYNGMADRLATAIEQQAAAERELRGRGRAVELLGGMAHRMQATRTDAELAEVLRCFLPRVLPAAPGALYVHQQGRAALCRVARWGDPVDAPEEFSVDACWALRRGQSHFVAVPGEDVRCRHVGEDARYHCEPVLAGGEVVGLLYLEGQVQAGHRAHLAALTENIALALVNQRLQNGLREQSVRDPLTGLHNRRYLEEALVVEVARARRSDQPLGMLMCDVDHFKRFNDSHGHEAGDLVLREVAAALAHQFRDGDIICRYGGEEFAALVPGGDVDLLVRRADALRAALARLAVSYHGEALPAIAVSAGVACFLADADEDGAATLRRADAALYRAKQNGRDRVEVDRLAGASKRLAA